MSITVSKKKSVIAEHGLSDNDSGSSQVQIAVLTERINSLTDHMRTHKHDYSSRRGLVKMVARRNHLLRYLARNDRAAYQALIQKLGLRK